MATFWKFVVISFWFSVLMKCSVSQSNKNQLFASHGKDGSHPLDLYSLYGERKELTEETPRNFKVALLGDSGASDGFEKVLELIKREKADMVIHLGDMSYYLDHEYGAQKWNRKINQVLGEKFPYFMLVGNHEARGWDSYVNLFHERLQHLPPGTCRVQSDLSNLGVKSYCNYKGVFMLLSGVGTLGSHHEGFIQSALERNQGANWKICAWHKNQNSLQLGHKIDEVGWAPYKLCQKYGALVATGHEHSYGRTKTLTDVGNHFKDHGAEASYDEVTLGPGKNFAFVAGTGGKSFRPYNCYKGELDPWWASIFTTNYVVKNGYTLEPLTCLDNPDELKQDNQLTIEFGALFLELNYEGNSQLARGHFVTTEGRVLDEFMVNKEG